MYSYVGAEIQASFSRQDTSNCFPHCLSYSYRALACDLCHQKDVCIGFLKAKYSEGLKSESLPPGISPGTSCVVSRCCFLVSICSVCVHIALAMCLLSSRCVAVRNGAFTRKVIFRSATSSHDLTSSRTGERSPAYCSSRAHLLSFY